ncbi:MAG: alpha/beta hydrolase [Sneathiellaceae bacterium]
MLDPELTPFLEAWDAGWTRIAADATPAERRAFFEVLAREMRLDTPPEVETDAEHWIDSPAGPVRVRLFRHRDGGSQPALIYMHGGAWMQGSPETHWDITARIAAWNCQTVVSIDYAKAPEHRFPAAVEQCAATVRWCFAEAGALGIDPARIAVGGDSAGGNLAAAMTLKFRDSDCPLSAQLLIYPAVEFAHDRPSYRENADGPLIKTAGMDAVAAMYCPDPATRRDPLAAPLLAGDHARLPPAFVAVAEHDPLRDDGIAYAEALANAGVPVLLDRGTGLIHGYLRAMAYCAASRDGLAAMCGWLRQRNERRSAA